VAPALAPLDAAHEPGYARRPAEEQAETQASIADVIARFDAQQKRWRARTSAGAWAVARQHAVVLAQAERQYALGRTSLTWRDESMAKNIRWILDQEPKGARMVVWAHNFHVSLASPPATPMGEYLARDLGADYVVLGFVFDRGAFQAMSGAVGLGEHTLGEAPIGNVAEAFHRAGLPLLALDLRHPPAGAVADWLAAPHLMRETGAVFSNEEAMTETVVLPQRFHAVIFVDVTTRARPLPRPDTPPR
jgi:erythromycin esterase